MAAPTCYNFFYSPFIYMQQYQHQHNISTHTHIQTHRHPDTHKQNNNQQQHWFYEFNSLQVGFYGIDSGQGCLDCACDRQGASSYQCDQRTGHCLCRPGIGGRTCGQCQPGYFGFSPAGCNRKTCRLFVFLLFKLFLFCLRV